MKKIVFFSDIHLGLKTSEIDRTQEIVDISLQAVKHACALKKKGEDVLLVVGGDVFNHNDPSDYLISQFIRILNPAVLAGISIYVVVGNHDAISNPDKKSCLQFLAKLRGTYKLIKVIDDMECVKWFTADYGHVYLTFFPHITRAHLEGTKYKSTQEYIDKKAAKIWKKVGPGQHQIVFSHLNVRGLIPGSEENLLKKSEVWLPETFINEAEHEAFVGSIPPTIIQAHIHSHQKHKNVNVVGSPLFCDFGEKEKKKFFCVISVPETFGEKQAVDFIETNCLKFVELDFDMTDPKFVLPNPKKMKKKLRNRIVKLNVTVDGHSATQDWEKIRQSFQKYAHYVKPVVPRYIRDRVTRNEKQSISLPPLAAAKLWLKTNKPKNWKRKLALAMDYIEKKL